MKRLDAWLARNAPYAVALAIGAALAWGVELRRLGRLMNFLEGRK